MNDTKHCEKQRMTFSEKLYIPEIARGMSLTFRRMFRKRFTRQFPEERWEPEGSYRGRPVLVRDTDNKERCVACGLCARVCPSMAIEVQASETADKKERYPVKFEINMLRCIYCGFCEEACPEEAIVMSKDYEFMSRSRKKGFLDKEQLLTPASELKDRLEFLKDYKNK